MAEWVNDLEVTIILPMANQVIPTSVEKEILERLSKEDYNFAIIDAEKDELIGNCGLMGVDNIQRTAELGIFIGNKEYWGQGYGQESIELILNFGFNILNLPIEKISIYDNFFEIGGHSLLLAKVHSRLSKEKGFQIELIDMFKYPAINSLANYIINGDEKEIATEEGSKRAERRKHNRNSRRCSLREQLGD